LNFKKLSQIIMMLKNPNFYVFRYIWMSWMVKFFHLFKKSKFGGANTVFCIKLFVGTFGAMAKIQSKYNVMISKSESFLELKGWFHVDCDFIIEIPLDFYIILVWSTLLKKYGKLSFGIVLWCTKSCFDPQHEFILFKHWI
jgi:hypothetical protein